MSNAANRPKITNLTLTNAATEYTFTVDISQVMAFTIQCRQTVDIQMAFTVNQSGTNFFTIPAGSAYTFDIYMVGMEKIYFQCPSQAGVTVEILTWY